MSCQQCGAPIEADSKFCMYCGTAVKAVKDNAAYKGWREEDVLRVIKVPLKNKNIATILAIFMGGLGAHKFYLEKYVQAAFYLLLCWTLIPIILGIIEGIAYAIKDDEAWLDYVGYKGEAI